jgi:hypothetical protein
MVPQHSSSTLGTIGAISLVAGIVAIGYEVPFFGPLISLTLPIITLRLRRPLWGSTPWTISSLSSWLAWVGLWLPALLSLATPLFYFANLNSSTGWLILPLCGPESTTAWVVPPLASAAVCAGGATAGARVGRSWPWVIAAWLAPWAHQLVQQLMPHRFIC